MNGLHTIPNQSSSQLLQKTSTFNNRWWVRGWVETTNSSQFATIPVSVAVAMTPAPLISAHLEVQTLVETALKAGLQWAMSTNSIQPLRTLTLLKQLLQVIILPTAKVQLCLKISPTLLWSVTQVPQNNLYSFMLMFQTPMKTEMQRLGGASLWLNGTQ